MYKVFYNDRIVFFVENDLDVNSSAKETRICKFSNLNQLKIEINNFLKSKHNILYIKCNHVENTFKQYSELFTIIEAAGGLVQNTNKEYLFIFRRNKWDLPKGKIEQNEKKEIAALREVEEECGISHVELSKLLTTTYHTYQLNGIDILKPTYWYSMKYNGSEKLTPQFEEEITEASWLSSKELKKVIDNTFLSILDVLKEAELIN